MGLPFAVILALLAVLVPLGFLSESGGSQSPPEQASVAEIADRVEAIRRLEFDHTPKAVTVSAQEAAREGIDALDRDYPVEQRRADEALYTMLGLLPDGTDLREEVTSIFGEQVAGYYDPRNKRLRIVADAGGSRVTNEMIIAHELVHALEDQAIGFDVDDLTGSSDQALASTAVVEGSATAVMYEYVDRHFDAEEALGGLLADSLQTPSTSNLPPFLVAQLVFPYTAGQIFVNDLYARTDSWQLVDRALRSRRPESTEQVMHPEKWFDREAPVPVRVSSPGPGYERVASGVFGEWQTDRLLRLTGQVQTEASEGWGGDRYALFEGPRGDLLVMHWVHDSARDGAEFVRALRRYAETAVPDGVRARVDAGADGVRLTLSRA